MNSSPSKQPKQAGASKEAQRKALSPKVKQLLYVRAGGRCQLCQDYLLESDELGYYEFNRGEMAHIVGQSLNATSPRSDFPLAKELRDDVENLMLLCARDHQTIDKAIEEGNFTVELLRELKREREAHIKHVTGIPQNHHTCIVRLVGRIRGNIVQVTRPECNSATLHHHPARFANFALDYHRQGVEIDITMLGEPEENPTYYQTAQLLIDREIQLIRQGVERGEIAHLSVFGFARIPALVYLGFQLGNKVGTTLFQRRRVDAKHWHWLREAPVQPFEWELIQRSPQVEKVALIINVTGCIHRWELPDNIDDTFNIFLLKPTGIDPHADAVLTVESLDQFRQTYRQLMAYLESKHKSVDQVHLFLAAPTAVAVACGLDLMPHAQPTLLVYDRMPRKFTAALSVN
ncbi:SAVED domain-containing protein [Hymenobacter sediminis]|uniref:SAVED domain-containing protein n=1 Tax=Hymenobacter sediminis TaxID=2218621 RepID=UPI000DA6569E|nr:SAVED domain-containing protein [Hymenobacter sediminis]RPD43906.1 SAVED domain-containing protein [Hymenobacter sediminis]